MKRVNWVLVREYYVTDMEATLSSAARKFKLNHSSVGRQCAKEGWVQQRADFLEKVAREGRKTAAAKLIKGATESVTSLLEKLAKVTDGALDSAARRQSAGPDGTGMLETEERVSVGDTKTPDGRRIRVIKRQRGVVIDGRLVAVALTRRVELLTAILGLAEKTGGTDKDHGSPIELD